MDGPWVNNTLEPHNTVLSTIITLTTTYKAVYATGALPNLANYFNYPGKMCHIKGMGRTSSGTTPGSIGFGVIIGPNTDNSGTVLGSVQSTWTASQSNYTFIFDFWARCQSIGVSGTISGMGVVFIQSSGIFPINYNTVPTVATFDTTATNYLSPQFYRTGSTAETIMAMDYFMESLN